MTERQRATCTTILNHFGLRAQIAKTCEELGELKDALSTKPLDYEHVAEEIADVEIMVEQLKQAMAIRSDVVAETEHKLARTMERIQTNYYSC